MTSREARASLSDYLERRRRREAAAREAWRGKELIVRHCACFVDLYGVFLAAQSWLKRYFEDLKREVINNTDDLSGDFISVELSPFEYRELAHAVIACLGHRVRDQYRTEFPVAVDWFDVGLEADQLASGMLPSRPEILHASAAIDLNLQFYVFCAKFDKEKIARQIYEHRKSAYSKQIIDDSKKGIINVYNEKRDYEYYSTFVSELKHISKVDDAGFYSMFTERMLIKSFSEKQVDVRLAVTAVDSMLQQRRRDYFVFSKDADFIPLKEFAGRRSLSCTLVPVVDGGADKPSKGSFDLSSAIASDFRPTNPFDVFGHETAGINDALYKRWHQLEIEWYRQQYL